MSATHQCYGCHAWITSADPYCVLCRLQPGPQTLDDAVLAAVRESQPGDVVIVHDQRCPLRSNDEADCRCVPLELKIGGRA